MPRGQGAVPPWVPRPAVNTAHWSLGRFLALYRATSPPRPSGSGRGPTAVLSVPPARFASPPRLGAWAQMRAPRAAPAGCGDDNFSRWRGLAHPCLAISILLMLSASSRPLAFPRSKTLKLPLFCLRSPESDALPSKIVRDPPETAASLWSLPETF